MFDEEECACYFLWKHSPGVCLSITDVFAEIVMFDEMAQSTKDKDRIQYKGYATIRTNLGNLNVELHGDRVSTHPRRTSISSG
jgi:hypothetical protein